MGPDRSQPPTDPAARFTVRTADGEVLASGLSIHEARNAAALAAPRHGTLEVVGAAGMVSATVSFTPA
jgi:hypothetical protein